MRELELHTNGNTKVKTGFDFSFARTMQRVLFGAVIFLGSFCCAARTPNVVFILADDLGYGDLSCFGATHFKTPACDRLAEEGMRFTDAHSPSAVCSPTRYAVLTGRYTWRSWLKNWVLFEQHPLLIDTERLTLGKMFQSAGYATGCIGKWHLGWGTELNPDFSGEVSPGPLEVGFDAFFGVPFSHNSSKPLRVFMRDRRIVNLKPGLAYDSEEAMKETMRTLEDTAITLSGEAVAFVERHKDRPFFLYYPTTNIHFPLTPNSRFKGATKSGVYGEFVVEFDWAVGELLAALDRNGLTENTIVVVTSDNGARPHPSLNGHECNGPWRGIKRQIYEGGHRIPLIVRWPGKVAKGAVSHETVCLTDFFATFARLLKRQVPENAGEDSYDVTDVLLGKPYKKPLREATVHHSVAGAFALRKGDWKLIEGSGDGDYPRSPKGGIDIQSKNPDRDPETGEWTKLDYFHLEPDGAFQLYNLKEDPAEKTDLAGRHPEIVEELKKLLDRYRTSGRSAPHLSAQADIPMREGLVLEYTFEDGVRDTSGSGHHGEANGDPVFAPGRWGRCLVLDGDGDFIDSGTFFPALRDAFTIACWVKPAETQHRYADILGNHAGGGITGCVIQQNDSRVNEYGFGYGNGTVYVDLPKFQLQPGRWQHVAVVKTADTMYLYLNGLRVAAADANGPMAVSTIHFRVGLGFEDPSRCFRGAIDTVRVWNRPVFDFDLDVPEHEKIEGFARWVQVNARAAAAGGFFAGDADPSVVFEVEAESVPQDIDRLDVSSEVLSRKGDPVASLPDVTLSREAGFTAVCPLPVRAGCYRIRYEPRFSFAGKLYRMQTGSFTYAVPAERVPREAVTLNAPAPRALPSPVSLDGNDWLLATDPGNVGRQEESSSDKDVGPWYRTPRCGAKNARVPGIIQEVFPAYHGLAWYWKEFICQENPLPEGRVLLCFGAVDYLAEVWVNGTFAGRHEGGEAPFVLDVTEAVRHDGSNLLSVRVLNPTHTPIDGITLRETPHRNKAMPYTNGSSFNTGGITESVGLRFVPAVYVADLYVRPDPETGDVRLEATAVNTLTEPIQSKAKISINEALSNELITEAVFSRRLPPGRSVFSVDLCVPSPKLWQLEDPFLYRAAACINVPPGRGVHSRSVRFGFRDFRIGRGFFRLNGRRIFVRSTHTGNHCPVGQVIPPAEAPSLLRQDLLNAKASGFNMVRFIAGVAHPRQLDLCDELGLMVYEECYAAWLLGDSPRMAERFDASLAGMIRRDRNHPSVVIWGLLNEMPDGPVFRHAVDSLHLVRFLDDTRLVLLQSGRWDGRFEIGSVSNPGSAAWETVWGAEDPGYSGTPQWASGGYVRGAGDAHVYTGVPLSAAEKKLIRTLGSGMKPVFLSEGGIGSVMHVIRELRCYEQAGVNLAAEDAVLMRGMAESFAADWKRLGMEGTYAFAEDMLTDSQRLHCRQRSHFFDLVRSNPQICGYNLTGMLDHGMTGEGLWRFWREWKPEIFDTLRDGWAPVRWCLFVEPLHGYAGQPIEIEAVLANEDVLGPGTYPVRARIAGPRGVVWEKAAEVVIPEPPPGGDGAFAVPVVKETVTFKGPPGRYTFAMTVDEGAAPAGGRQEFQLSDAEAMPHFDAQVRVIGLDENLVRWVTSHGIRCLPFSRESGKLKHREVILLAKPPSDVQGWKVLARQVAQGCAAVFLTPQSLQRQGDPVGGMLLEEKGRFFHFNDWLYHKECVARKHEVFEGLPSGVMDWDYFGPVVSRGVFQGQRTPDEAVVAAFALGYPCPGGYTSAIMMGAYRFGAGVFVINTLSVLEHAGSHPAADRLLLNLVRYATKKTDAPPAPLPADFEKRLARLLPEKQSAEDP